MTSGRHSRAQTNLRPHKRFYGQQALRSRTYTWTLRLYGKERSEPSCTSNCGLFGSKRFEEAKSVLGWDPVARRVLGENDETTLLRCHGGQGPFAIIDDLQEP